MSARAEVVMQLATPARKHQGAALLCALLWTAGATGCHLSTPRGYACNEQYLCPADYVCDVTLHCADSCGAGDYADGGFCAGQLSKVIGAGGGTLTAADGTSITIPPGALHADVTITLAPVTLSAAARPPPGFGTAAGPAWRLGPEGQPFALPVMVTAATASPLPAGLTTAGLIIATSPVATPQWSSLGGAPVDATHVRATTLHFSYVVPQTAQPAADGGSLEPDGGAPDGGPALTDGGPVLTDGGPVLTDGGPLPEDGGIPPGPDAGRPTSALGTGASAASPHFSVVYSPGSLQPGQSTHFSVKPGATPLGAADGGSP